VTRGASRPRRAAAPTSAPIPTQFSTHADLHRHQCCTGTFSSIVLSLLLSSIYLWGFLAAPSLIPIEARHLSGIFAPYSGSWRQTAPRSPRWLIARRRPSKPSPARAATRPRPGLSIYCRAVPGPCRFDIGSCDGSGSSRTPPPPRKHGHRCHRVFGPNRKLRPSVTALAPRGRPAVDRRRRGRRFPACGRRSRRAACGSGGPSAHPSFGGRRP